MDLATLVVVGWFPALVVLLGAGYVYYDAPKYGMSPTKWGLVALVPFFGFFAYIFERDDRTEDTSERDAHFVDGPFEIHKSRADDVPLGPDDHDDDEESDRETA